MPNVGDTAEVTKGELLEVQYGDCPARVSRHLSQRATHRPGRFRVACCSRWVHLHRWSESAVHSAIDRSDHRSFIARNWRRDLMASLA